jgi:hypothetical protein
MLILKQTFLEKSLEYYESSILLQTITKNLSNKYNVPESNMKTTVVRAIFNMLSEPKKQHLIKRSPLIKRFVQYYMVMTYFFFLSLFGARYKEEKSDILFDEKYILKKHSWFPTYYDPIIKYLSNKNYEFKVFLNPLLIKEIFAKKNKLYEYEIPIIDRRYAYFYFDKVISRQILTNEIFSFRQVYEVSNEIKIDFVNIYLRIIRQIAVSESQSKNITANFLITAGDHYFNGIHHYIIKRNGIKNLITIQNGMRVKNTEGACNYFYSDYYLAHNDETASKYLNNVFCGKKLSIGSFLSGVLFYKYKNLNLPITNDILFWHHPAESKLTQMKFPGTLEMVRKIIDNLAIFMKQNPSFSLHYITKNDLTGDHFFEECKEKLNSTNVKFSSIYGNDAYKCIYQSKLVINIWSTMGYESLGFDKRILYISYDNLIDSMLLEDFKNNNYASLHDKSYDAFENRVLTLLNQEDDDIDKFYEKLKDKYNPIKINPLEVIGSIVSS